MASSTSIAGALVGHGPRQDPPCKVPPELAGLCFRCLHRGHTRAKCSSLRDATNVVLRVTGRATCPLLARSSEVGRKRGRSPMQPSEHHRVLQRLRQGGCSHASIDTFSPRSASTGEFRSAPAMDTSTLIPPPTGSPHLPKPPLPSPSPPLPNKQLVLAGAVVDPPVPLTPMMGFAAPPWSPIPCCSKDY